MSGKDIAYPMIQFEGIVQFANTQYNHSRLDSYMMKLSVDEVYYTLELDHGIGIDLARHVEKVIS